MSEWKEVIIGDYIDLISGFAFKSANFTENHVVGTLPVIKIKNVANGDTNLKDVVYHEFNESLSKYLILKGDVLIAMTGNHPQALTQVVGDVSRYKLDVQALLNQRVGKLVVKNDADLDFIYYLFKDEEVQNTLANNSSGSANQANISKGDILGLQLNIPELPEQKAIAEVLSSLDNKIDLLHRQNQTLEQMAETLFRKWFVEDASEEWEVFKVSDFADHIKESVKPQNNPLLEYNHYSIPAFDSGKTPQIEKGTEIKSNKYKVQPKTILISKLNPHFPRVWDIDESVEGMSICSTEFQVLKLKKDSYYDFLLYLLKSEQAKSELIMAASGTSGSHQRVKPQDILNIEISMPLKSTAIQFSQLIVPVQTKQQANQRQLLTLKKIRDNLLPKLMNGGIKIEMN